MNDSTDQTKWKLWILLFLCFGTWYLAHAVQGRMSPLAATLSEQWSCVGTAVSAGVTAVFLYNRWLWRLPFLHPWFEATPLIQGRYEGVVTRLFREGQEEKVEIKITAEVRQTTVQSVFYLQSSVDQTAEVHTEACQLFLSKDSRIYLEGVYEMTKNELHRESLGSTRSYLGALRLVLDDNTRPNKLSGSYWSYDFTRGRIELQRVS